MFRDFLNSRLPIKSQADKTTKNGYVEFGYGQVEPNHLSAQRNGQIYAQLPANPNIEILEQGQFVKYDYAANGNGIGEVNFTGAGEWMLNYNEIKLYREHLDGTKQWDCEFALLKDDYQARVYSPYDWEATELEYHNGMYLNGKDELGNDSITVETYVTLNVDKQSVDVGGTRCMVTFTEASTNEETGVETPASATFVYNGVTYELDETGTSKVKVPVTYKYDDVTKDVLDIYEWNATNDPWNNRMTEYREKMMRPGTAMVPRVFKTMPGDIYTTNFVKEATLAVGDLLYVGDKGILSKTKKTVANADGAVSGDMTWQVVKVYTVPDGQQGVKLMRIV